MTGATFVRPQTRSRTLLVGVMVLGVGAVCNKQTRGPEALALAPSVAATEDVTPPTLTAFDFTPKEINTSEGPATVTVNFTVTDDVSGAAVQQSLRQPFNRGSQG